MSTADNNDHQKLDDVSAKIKELMRHNYSREKNGWVTFKGSKIKKVKLRKHISNLAKTMTSVGGSTFEENRETLINYYNQDGLTGIGRAYIVYLNNAVAKIKVKD